MNLSCVICADILSSSADVSVTPCGHLFHHHCLFQWLDRSKTCPQCRNKCYTKSVHKVYFNIANLDTSSMDLGSLQQQLDDLKLQLQCRDKEEEKSKKEIEELKNTRKKCMETINGLESKMASNKFALSQFAEQVKVLKNETKFVEAQRKEIAELKRQIGLMESVQTMISATASEVEKLLEQDSSAQSLGTWIVILKKELKACETKKSEIRNTLKIVQSDLRKAQEGKRNLESKISILESENYQLLSKVESLERDKIKYENNNVTDNINAGTSQQCPKCNSIKSKTLLNVASMEDSINLNETFSPGIPQKVKQIEDSDSPYLNIKSSNLGLQPLLKMADRIKGNANLNGGTRKNLKPDSIFETKSNFGILKKTRSEEFPDKYSIFKKPRLLEPQSNQSSSLAFNGLGGSEKILFNPTKSISLLEDDMKSKPSNINNRLKSGKLRKFPSVTKMQSENSLDKFLKKS